MQKEDPWSEARREAYLDYANMIYQVATFFGAATLFSNFTTEHLDGIAGALLVAALGSFTFAIALALMLRSYVRMKNHMGIDVARKCEESAQWALAVFFLLVGLALLGAAMIVQLNAPPAPGADPRLNDVQLYTLVGLMGLALAVLFVGVLVYACCMGGDQPEFAYDYGGNLMRGHGRVRP